MIQRRALDLALRLRVRLDLARYSDSQERDEAGRWTAGGGGAEISTDGARTWEGRGAAGTVSTTTERAWGGRSTEGASSDAGIHADVGKLGESIALVHLQQTIPDAVPFNDVRNNTPVDIIGDHQAIEVKAGLSTNGSSAQQWRATIGEPGKAEKAALKGMTPDDKRAFNQQKAQAILDRKQGALDTLGRELGTHVAGKTVGVIINPSTKVADVYEFNGFHLRIGWNSDLAQGSYRGSYKFSG